MFTAALFTRAKAQNDLSAAGELQGDLPEPQDGSEGNKQVTHGTSRPHATCKKPDTGHTLRDASV